MRSTALIPGLLPLKESRGEGARRTTVSSHLPLTPTLSPKGRGSHTSQP
jgi:hypothetical protein